MWSVKDLLQIEKQIKWLKEQYLCLAQSQNNVIIHRSIIYNSDEKSLEEAINEYEYNIGPTKILALRVQDTYTGIKTKYFLKPGKGDYGFGSTPITLNDLEEVGGSGAGGGSGDNLIYINTNPSQFTIGGYAQGQPVTPPEGFNYFQFATKMFSNLPTISFNVSNVGFSKRFRL
jgi:hypothetical protein